MTISGTGFTTNTSLVQVSVDGTSCIPVSSTLSSIICDLQTKDMNATAQLGTNSGSQTNGYHSGSGLRYRRYNTGSLGTKTYAGLRNAINSNSASITLVE